MCCKERYNLLCVRGEGGKKMTKTNRKIIQVIFFFENVIRRAFLTTTKRDVMEYAKNDEIVVMITHCIFIDLSYPSIWIR